MPAKEAEDGRLSGLVLMRVLGEDERRMYLVLRERGGAMNQKDLVGLGIFSRAKVSRVLDRLEAERVVVRGAPRDDELRADRRRHDRVALN